MQRYLTVYHAHIRCHNPHIGQYLQVLYLHLGFEPTIRHQYTACPDLLPTISKQEVLEIEATLRIAHNCNRTNIFPDESLMVQAEVCEAQTPLLGPRETPLQACLLIRPSRDAHLHRPL